MQDSQDIILRKALLGLVLSVSKGIKGRKKLQKLVYLANSAGWNVFKDYRFHHYGPYSDSLLSEIQNLQEAGLVRIKETEYNEGPFYLHRLTESGDSLLDILLKEVRTIDPKLIRKTEKLVSELNYYSSDELEVMASLYFLRQNTRSLDRKNLAIELKRLKPHVNEKRIERGFEVFDIMGKFANR
jgi:uncharacterized protein YwgA